MKWVVLEKLRLHAPEWVRQEEILEHCSISPRELDAAAAGLRREGYEVDHEASLGWRVAGCSDRMMSHELSRGLDTRIMGCRILTTERTTSTNDIAWREALAGAPEGTVVFAEEQTAGRGRMGRRWHAPRFSALLMSVVLRPGLGVQQSHLLTVLAAVAAAEALRDIVSVQARIRWPNDITIKQRKVAGILVEGRSLATGTAFVVGIGLNVNIPREAFPAELQDSATSLLIETGRQVNRVDLARRLLGTLERWYSDLRSGGYGHIARCWRRLSSTLGHRVVLMEDGREYRGRVLDLSLDDGLIVRLDEGVTRVFHASTVTLRQLPERWGIESS